MAWHATARFRISLWSSIRAPRARGAPHWRYHGAQLGYYEYARVAVSGGKTDFNPVYELQATMGTLCNDLNDRAQAVNQAVANGITAKLHPSAIPAQHLQQR